MAREHKPKIIVAGASAYPRTMEYAPFREIADDVGATLFVDLAHVAGLGRLACIRRRFPSPISLRRRRTRRCAARAAVLCSVRSLRQAIDKSVFPGIQGGPLMHTIAAKAVAFGEALRPEFTTYQRSVVENAQAMADEFVRGGLRLVAGGTDTHLMLVDVSVREPESRRTPPP